MKKKIFFGLAAIAIAAVSIVACKRNFDKFDSKGTFAGTTLSSCCDSLGTVTLSGVIEGERSLSCDTIYYLDGKVYVDSLATLNITEGTVIRAKYYSNPADVSALVVTRGGKLNADGTASCPIIFTSERPNPAPGDWGGIVLLGSASTNKGTSLAIEGINLPSVPNNVSIFYGGTNDNDNSGRLTFVRIEYAGAAIATDNELNGLTCGGVGDGTKLDHIQVYKGNDDGFEFFGGTVNATYLFAYEPDDDAFDFDFGYRGKIQFALSILRDTAVYSANPNGIESDNDGIPSYALPYTQPTLSNLTVIGLSDSTTARQKGLLNGGIFRRNSRLRLYNSIFEGFPTGITVTADSAQYRDSIQYNLVQAFVTISNVTLPGTNTTYRASSANGSIQLGNPFSFSPIQQSNFVPAVGSPARTGANFTRLPDAFFKVKNYRGAFGTSHGTGADQDLWQLNDWAKFND